MRCYRLLLAVVVEFQKRMHDFTSAAMFCMLKLFVSSDCAESLYFRRYQILSMKQERNAIGRLLLISAKCLRWPLLDGLRVFISDDSMFFCQHEG